MTHAQRFTIVLLLVSLGVQWATCQWVRGMGSGAFFPDNALLVAMVFGLPTLAVLAVVWLFSGAGAEPVRVVGYGSGLHLLAYGLILADLAMVPDSEDRTLSWIDRNPDGLGLGLGLGGAVLLIVMGIWSLRVRRLP